MGGNLKLFSTVNLFLCSRQKKKWPWRDFSGHGIHHVHGDYKESSQEWQISGVPCPPKVAPNASEQKTYIFEANKRHVKEREGN